MHGERERKCLERIRQEFNKWYCYGISYDDLVLLQSILNEAKPNPESSKFPDFIFANGFIEHFQITSSKVTRKGATHQCKYSQYREKVDAKIEAIQQNMNRNPCSGDVQKYHWSFPQPEHSYENLKKSLKQVWYNHINSLNNYAGGKQTGVFVVEYPEIALAMCENISSDIKEGLRYDGLLRRECFNAYRLSRDKEMLDYLYQFSEQIVFAIYVYCEGIEIIKLENIPYHKKLLPHDFDVCPLIVQNNESLYWGAICISDESLETGGTEDE